MIEEESSKFQVNNQLQNDSLNQHLLGYKKSNLVKVIKTPWQNYIEKKHQDQLLLTTKSFLNQTYMSQQQKMPQLQLQQSQQNLNQQQNIYKDYKQADKQIELLKMKQNQTIQNPFLINKIDLRSLSPIKTEIDKYALNHIIMNKPKMTTNKKNNIEQNKSSQSLKNNTNCQKSKQNYQNNSPLSALSTPICNSNRIGMCNFCETKTLLESSSPAKLNSIDKLDNHLKKTNQFNNLQIQQKEAYLDYKQELNQQPIQDQMVRNITIQQSQKHQIMKNLSGNTSTSTTSSSSSEKHYPKKRNTIIIKKIHTENKVNQIKEIFDEDEEIPIISAKYWTVYNCANQKFLYGRKSQKQVEIASLTKIMTCIVVCQFFKRNDLNFKQYNITVSRQACTQIGTTAELQKGDIISIQDLLYGLMLPSGNDAAVALAEGIGLLLIFEELNEFSRIQDTRQLDIKSRFPYTSDDLLRQFTREMNKMAIQIGLDKSNFASVHGLVNNKNVSTAKDLAKLSKFALEDKTFQTIVKTQQYSCSVEDKDCKRRIINWQNTNKLLEEGFEGIKTGITDTAGPCLASSFRIKQTNNEEIHLIVILLNCKSMDQRWEDCKSLIKWSLQKYFQYFI